MMLLALGYLGLRVVEDVVEVVAVDAVPKIAAVPEINRDVDQYWLLSLRHGRSANEDLLVSHEKKEGL